MKTLLLLASLSLPLIAFSQVTPEMRPALDTSVDAAFKTQEPSRPTTKPTSKPTRQIASYDPLKLPAETTVERVELTAHRGDRDIPVLVFMPKKTRGKDALGPMPIVLFSHGLGGNNTGTIFYGEHLAARGFAVAFMQHAGSDENVWLGLPKWKILGALKKAASNENLILRTEDVTTVIDALMEWNGTKGHELEGRLNTDRIGMSGHSFGAVTTQMVSGQKSGLFGAKLMEPRLTASIAFSPSPPKIGTPEKGFAEIFLPMMLMTGTNDSGPIGGNDFESRKLVYPALPKSNDRYELVLFGAEHSAFTDKKLAGEKNEHNPNHHKVILALCTAYWDMYLNENEEAATWLLGSAPAELMEEGDTFQHAAAE